MDVFDGGVAVLAERRRAQHVEAQGIGPVDIDEIEGLDHVPERLGDLALVERQIAMYEELIRQVIPGREQERRPEDAMEAKDVLAQYVMRCRPVAVDDVLALARVRERAQVV